MLAECRKALVSKRWVDSDTGIDGHVDARSRPVAKDFKRKGIGEDKEDSAYASTPPLEGLSSLCSKAAALGKRRKALFMGSRKARLNPKCEEDVHIGLPKESGAPQGICGKLVFLIYGMRPTAQAWVELYSRKIEDAGFTRAVGNAV